MEYRKDWVNSLGLMFMSYATFTDGNYSGAEGEEVVDQLQMVCNNIKAQERLDVDLDYNQRLNEISFWYQELINSSSLKSEFGVIITHISELGFWSKENSILVCKALYKVAMADNKIVHGEADVLTDVMTIWEVTSEQIEDSLN